MARFQFYSGGQLCSMNANRIAQQASRRHSGRGSARETRGKSRVPQGVANALMSQSRRFGTRFNEFSEENFLSVPSSDTCVMLVPTESLVVEGARVTDIRRLSDDYGLEVVQEGREGKVLLKAPEAGEAGVRMAFDAARSSFEAGHVSAAHPNFLRVIRRPTSSRSSASTPWNLDNNGRPGVIGADVHGPASWTITRGVRSIRIAVLDEGVDSLHPNLRHAIVDEADFVDGHIHARPSGDDAHGTACAGIVVSNSSSYPGLAEGLGLIGVRIAKSDSQGYWIFDDFDTADAIDWSWKDAKADVLSNSWGGGPAVDVITRAFERARTKGRGGRGSVVVVAAGNDESRVDYPGNLPNLLTVGASNQWDQRKTRTSKDGETGWGSNYGDGLDVMAPGVKIATTDIRGRRGYSGTLFTRTFNGTSAATPHVAAAAGLILSVSPKLHEDQVRDIIIGSADPLGSKDRWNKYTGHGRLNTYLALRKARR